jgi:hypothetical protein
MVSQYQMGALNAQIILAIDRCKLDPCDTQQNALAVDGRPDGVTTQSAIGFQRHEEEYK